MTDLERKDENRDERVEKTPTSESTQSNPQGNLKKEQDTNLRKDDASKKEEEKDRGTANTGMGRQDSNVGKSSGNIGSSHTGSPSWNKGTSQTPGKDSGGNKGSNPPGMKR